MPLSSDRVTSDPIAKQRMRFCVCRIDHPIRWPNSALDEGCAKMTKFISHDPCKFDMPERRPIEIVTTPTNDMRSCHVNSDKVHPVPSSPRRSIEDAVRDIARAFRNHLLPNSFDDDRCYNVHTMNKIGAK
jgi:hypothetical protein